jgi:rhodanese-related sulfurtransferase
VWGFSFITGVLGHLLKGLKKPKVWSVAHRTEGVDMPNTMKITKDSTMQEVLENYPSAQRALFQRYHIGGCHSCGYEMTDVLENVAKSHDITDMNEVLTFIEEAEALDQRIQISPKDVAEAMKTDKSLRLLDVRMKQESELAHIEGATLMTEELARELMSWPKDTTIVFHCHSGKRSMDAASYFAGHGFKNVRSMTGGIDAWSQTVDSNVPRYDIERDMSTGRAVFVPLRSVVSQAKGCVTP